MYPTTARRRSASVSSLVLTWRVQVADSAMALILCLLRRTHFSAQQVQAGLVAAGAPQIRNATRGAQRVRGKVMLRVAQCWNTR